ncbi:MAG TPA: hypothetical protein PK257_00580 [Candidatus Woesebacteria bacterium]|nr:hypothetical protein [Candidatus Woesebacteria bacterium]
MKDLVFQEIKRVMEKIEDVLEEKKIIISKEIFFDEELLPKIEAMCIRGTVYGYNATIGSFRFQNETRQQKISCLILYKKLFSVVLDNN